MAGILLFYVTNPSKGHAERISRELVGRKLVACTNIFPVNSLYAWQGRLENGDEYVLVAKTLPGRESAVRRVVEELHEDETPCIISWNVNVNKKYFEWVRGEVSD